MQTVYRSILVLGLLCLVACGGSVEPQKMAAAQVDTARISNAASEPEQWLTYGGSYDETRHSALQQINSDTLPELGVGWVYEMSKPRGVEATPIVVDGVMYVSGSWSVVYALDAKTGAELWVYDPQVSGEDAAKGCCDVINRGVAVHDGKVFVGVFDGRLEALDAATGQLLWSQLTVDQTKPYTISGAPRVFKDKVIIGNAGAELGVRGYVTAYDVDSGELAWRFYTVPNPNKEPDGAASDDILARLANDTWGDTGGWTTDGGGGTVWDSIVYDTVNDQVLIGVGNGSPWLASIRDPDSDGPNLFLSSIVALDADTGAYRWHYQGTPRDQWDYTATQQMTLADLPVGENGEMRRVVMQAPKNGFFYVIDAADGALISATPFAVQTWTTGEVDELGRPVEIPAAREIGEVPYMVAPGPTGAHNWHPMAYNPNTGLVYIPTNFFPLPYAVNDISEHANTDWVTGYDYQVGWPIEYPPGTFDALRSQDGGGLLAWDPVAREPRWAIPMPMPFNGGVLSTEGNLVFQGNKSGEFVAYDATTGDPVWSHRLTGNAAAAPMTYEIDGEQYLAVLSGWGSTSMLTYGLILDQAVTAEPGRVITFKIGGQAELPPAMAYSVIESPKGEDFGSPEELQLGLRRYSENCQFCHGAMAISSGVLPDLRWSPITGSEAAWDSVVLEGAKSATGMKSFAHRLSKEETDAIRAYLLKQAWVAVGNGEAVDPRATADSGR